MKVCTVTQSYAPNAGGGRTVLAAERAWYRAHGVEHVTIVPGPNDSRTVSGGATIYTVASPMVPGSKAYRLLLRSPHVAKLLRDEMADVIETHCIYNLPWTALNHRRKYGGIVSAFFMTDVPNAYVASPLRKWLGKTLSQTARRVAERYLRALYRRCDAVLAISDVMRQRLVEIGVPNPLFVPLGVDFETFSPNRRSAALRTQLGAADETLLLVYAGRLDSEKQPGLLVDAMALLPRDLPVTLILAGVGPMRDELAARAARLGRIEVLGQMPREELAALLASSDVYVSGMAHETFGLSVAEAQACGLPVLGVRAGAMLERVKESPSPDADGVLVAPNSAAEMAAVLQKVSRAEWRRMGERAERRVRTELSWDRTFTSVHEIYRDKLEERRRRR